jgi:hypothetical protein
MRRFEIIAGGGHLHVFHARFPSSPGHAAGRNTLF